jgi:tetratricopeptide (TPR) repeat protein
MSNSLALANRPTGLRGITAALTCCALFLALLECRPSSAQTDNGALQNRQEPAAGEPANGETEKGEADRVVALIDQLGAPSFSQRELAARALREMGIQAFSMLRAARNSNDPEIRQRVKKLVSELLPQMLRRDVPTVEASLIEDYLQLNEDERRIRIKTVSETLMPQFGSMVLLRIAQLETNTTLTRLAAAGIVGGGFPEKEPPRSFRRAPIHVVGGAILPDMNPGLSWIQEYRKSLNDPGGSIDAFESFADDEQALLRRNPVATDEQDVIGPLRRYALDLRVQAGMLDESETYAAELFDQSPPESTARQLLLEKMFTRGYFPLILQLGDGNDEWFASHRNAQYLHAAAAEAIGQDELAQRLYEQAFAAAENEDIDRINTAGALRRLGINRWCEREYRAVFQRPESKIEPTSFEARRYLAAMLHQQLRDREAAEIMKEAIELCEQDNTGQATDHLEAVPLTSATLPQFYADMHFFLAGAEGDDSAEGDDGDDEAQIEHFRQAFVYSKENSDALCEAYRIKDDRWQAELREIINETVADLESERTRYELALVRQPNHRLTHYRIAQRDNEIAWILVNTGGNLNDALRYAQQSVEFHPAQAYSIDTLATCYFALQEIDRAIEYERMALRLAPYREDIARSLDQFRAAAR